MATPVAGIKLLRNGKSFPFHLLRGSVSCASTAMNLETKFAAVDPTFQPQIPVSVQYFRGLDSAVPINGYNTTLLNPKLGAIAELNRLQHYAKSVSSDDAFDSDYIDYFGTDGDADRSDDDVDDDDDDDDDDEY